MGVGSNCHWIVRYWYKRSVKHFFFTFEYSRAVASANRLQTRLSVSKRVTRTRTRSTNPTPTHLPTRRERSSTNWHCHHHRHRIRTKWWRTINWTWLPPDTAFATTKTIVTVVQVLFLSTCKRSAIFLQMPNALPYRQQQQQQQQQWKLPSIAIIITIIHSKTSIATKTVVTVLTIRLRTTKNWPKRSFANDDRFNKEVGDLFEMHSFLWDEDGGVVVGGGGGGGDDNDADDDDERDETRRDEIADYLMGYMLWRIYAQWNPYCALA